MSEHLQYAVANLETGGRVAVANDESGAAKPTIRFLSTEREWNAPLVQQTWRRLLTESSNPEALFSTPEWFDNKYKTKREDLRVAIVRHGAKITAIAPLLLGQQEFDLKLCRMKFKTAQLLGGEALTQRPEVYEPLLKAIFQTFDVAAIHFRMLPTEGPCWKAVQSSRAGFVHVHGRFKMYFLGLRQTFKEYFAARFDSSHRSNLKRRVKLLREQGEHRLWRCSECTAAPKCARLWEKGGLRLQRISAPEDVPEFLQAGGQVAQASWQAAKADYLIQETPEWSAHLSDLAGRGLLRSYLLWCGPQVCAYALGFQGSGSYYGSLSGYDPSMAKFSPGTVMLLLLLEDLMQHDPPGRLNFGEGEDEYKREFATSAAEVANVTILRRSIMGGVRTAGFGTYRMLRGLRRWKNRAGKARVGFIQWRRSIQFKEKAQEAKGQGQLAAKPDGHEEHLKSEICSTCTGKTQVDAATRLGTPVATIGGPR